MQYARLRASGEDRGISWLPERISGRFDYMHAAMQEINCLGSESHDLAEAKTAETCETHIEATPWIGLASVYSAATLDRRVSHSVCEGHDLIGIQEHHLG